MAIALPKYNQTTVSANQVPEDLAKLAGVPAPQTSSALGKVGGAIKSVAGFAWNLGKEIVAAPIRALATPFAMTYQDIQELRGQVRPEEVNVPFLGNIGMSSGLRKGLSQGLLRSLDVGLMLLPGAGSAAKAATKGIEEAGIQAMEKVLASGGTEVAANLAAETAKATARTAATKIALEASTAKAAKSFARQTGEHFVATAPKDAAIGALYGTLGYLSDTNNESFKADELLKSMALGGLFGAVAPTALGVTTKGITKGIGTSLKGGRILGEAVAGKLETAIEKPKPENFKGILFAENLKEPTTPTFKEKVLGGTAKIVRNVIHYADQMPVWIKSKSAVGYAMARTMLDVGVSSQKIENSIHLATHYSAYFGETKLRELAPIVDSYKDIWQEAMLYRSHLNALDRIRQKQDVQAFTFKDSVTGEMVTRQPTAEDINASAHDLFSSLTPDQQNRIQKFQEIIGGFFDKMAEERVTYGRASPEELALIKEAHPNYLPNGGLDYNNQTDKEVYSTMEGVGRSLSVSKSASSKLAVGSERQLEDPTVQLMRYIMTESSLNARNKAALEVFGELDKSMGENLLNLVQLKSAENTKERFSLIAEMKAKATEVKAKYGDKAATREEMMLRQETIEKIIKGQKKEIKSAGKQLSTRGKMISGLYDEASTVMEEARSIAADFDTATIGKIKSVLKEFDSITKRLDDLNSIQVGSKKQLNRATGAVEDLGIGLQRNRMTAMDKLELTDIEIEHLTQNLKELKTTIKGISDKQVKNVDIPQGFGRVKFLKNGFEEEWLVPKDLSNAMRYLDPTGTNALMKFLANNTLGKALTMPASIVRAISVGKNPVFLITNFLRDVPTALFQTGKFSIDDSIKGLFAAISNSRGKANELYKFAESGQGMVGNLYREHGDPEKMITQLFQPKNSELNFFSREVKHVKKILSGQVVEDAGKVIEDWTRLAVASRAIKNGITNAEEVGFISRNATVDFSQMGTVTEVINKVVPFFNARVQGLLNVGTLAKNDPLRFGRRAFYAAVYPTMVLNTWNTRFDAYDNIPDYIKNQKWIIMLGQTPGTYNNKPISVPLYLTIPKAEAAVPMSMLLDRALNIGRKHDNQTTQEFIGDLIKNTTPVTESSILPPGISQWAEVKSNYSFFRQNQIEPEFTQIDGKWYTTKELDEKFRTKYNTSLVAKTLGSVLNWSPDKIDYVLKQGVVGDLIRLGDITTNDWAINDQKGEVSAFEKASTAPLLRSFIGAEDTAGIQVTAQKKQEETKTKNTQKIIRRRNALAEQEALSIQQPPQQ